jgi:hypothetical protein
MHRRLSYPILVVLSLTLLSLTLLSVACASGNVRPANIAAPSVEADLNGTVFFGSGDRAPANIDVTVTNNAGVPITLRRVEIDSPGMGTYGIVRTSRLFRDTIAPGETKRVTVFTTAITTVRNPSEPLTLRAIAEFESGKDRWREITMR